MRDRLRRNTSSSPHSVIFLDHTSRPGGAELSLLRYLKQAQDGGVAELITFEDGYLADEAERAGRSVHRIGRGKGILRRLSILTDLRRVLAGRSCTVVANSLTSALYLALLPKGSRTYNYYLREDLSPEWLRGARRFVAIHMALPRFDAFIANSRWTASTLPPRLAAKPVFVAYPVSGVAPIQTAPKPRDSTRLRILSLSRLSEWKGVHVLLLAMKELRRRGFEGRFSLTVAGDDIFETTPYLSRLRGLAADLDDDVRFVGHVEDVSGELDSHDVLVSCSLLAEPFGQVIVQGLAHGLVTIGTGMGGPAEVIKDHVDGLLVPPGAPEVLADSLERLLTDPNHWLALATAGLEKASRYSDQRTVAELTQILSKLTRRPPAPGVAPRLEVSAF